MSRLVVQSMIIIYFLSFIVVVKFISMIDVGVILSVLMFGSIFIFEYVVNSAVNFLHVCFKTL